MNKESRIFIYNCQAQKQSVHILVGKWLPVVHPETMKYYSAHMQKEMNYQAKDI